MNKKKKRVAIEWCDKLKELVQMSYCLGAASENEIRAATVDFLVLAADKIYHQITEDTIIPPAR